MRTWNGWLAKKSAALTRFWLLANWDIFGTSSVRPFRIDYGELHLDEGLRHVNLATVRRVD